MNCTLVKMAHAMLSDAGLPNTYWEDAILYAMHVLNRVPVDLGCLCTSYCLIGHIFDDYFSCFPLWLIR